jgi:hypothetical protein
MNDRRLIRSSRPTCGWSVQSMMLSCLDARWGVEVHPPAVSWGFRLDRLSPYFFCGTSTAAKTQRDRLLLAFCDASAAGHEKVGRFAPLWPDSASFACPPWESLC